MSALYDCEYVFDVRVWPQQASSGTEFETVLRLDTAFEIITFGHGGLLPFVVRQLAKQ